MYTVPVPASKINQQTRDRIGEAIYLLGYIIEKCNWEKGCLGTSYEVISVETGFPIATIKRWMQLLVAAGEITTRRIPIGTLITISEYDAIARTRMGKGRANAPVAWSKPDPSARSKVAPADHEKTANGLSKSAIPDHLRTASGLSNIKKTMYKTKEKSFVQTKSPLSLDDNKKGAEPLSGHGNKQDSDIFDYTDPWEYRLEEVQKTMAAMDDATRDALTQKALSAMASDKRPFARVFVRTTEDGRLEPSGNSGPEMMLRRVWEILQLEEESGEGASNGM